MSHVQNCVAITIENLGKRYVRGPRKDHENGLRHQIESFVRSPHGWLTRRKEAQRRRTEFWALRDVSLHIGKGEVVGIIGNNGAGKSTLLKLLSRITAPTEGRIIIDGRIASLLEVGTGFHQELTGRENIFLNAAILGMSRAEINRKFDEIVAFSEIEDFLDTPVKRYSSGMYVRLAFAVAAHLEPDLLIVDEVLAVGDAAFQKKCLGKMGSVAQSGRTVLFVSHNMEAIRTLCQRCVWMKDGHVHEDGPVDQVVQSYYSSLPSDHAFSWSTAEYGLKIKQVVLRNQWGEECRDFCPGEDLSVEIAYEADRPIDRPIFAIGILGASGSCFTSNMLLDGHRPAVLKGSGKLGCTFRSIPLLPQQYTVRMSIRAANFDDFIFDYQDVAEFSVSADLAKYGYRGDFIRWARYSTSVVVPYEWKLPDGSVIPVSLASEERERNVVSL
ncbi:MAG TPA: ABC transporter ATP-binding protein [Acidobacteriaceae bacterium]|nr:ABC transporter ATP-binding protein [Acidobacteriaceae bacterium]